MPPNSVSTNPLGLQAHGASASRSARVFPYWLIGFLGLLTWLGILIVTNDKYNAAWHFIIPGIGTTISATIVGFLVAMLIGLLAGLGRIARNPIARSVAQLYIEFVRGVPILVLLFTLSLVIVPQVARGLGIPVSSITEFVRGTTSLALIYGAYLAEVFRGGIESVPKGQVEAGHSLGMSNAQTMRTVVLPQAVRNMIPAIGNDLIAMLKDSSLLSVLAITELTQNARLYASSTFDFRATYIVLTFLYASMTLVLSLLLRWYRSRLGLDDD